MGYEDVFAEIYGIGVPYALAGTFLHFLHDDTTHPNNVNRPVTFITKTIVSTIFWPVAVPYLLVKENYSS